MYVVLHEKFPPHMVSLLPKGAEFILSKNNSICMYERHYLESIKNFNKKAAREREKKIFESIPSIFPAKSTSHGELSTKHC